MTATKINEMARVNNAKIVIGSQETGSAPKSDNTEKVSKWNEAKTEDGKSYYWHTITGGKDINTLFQ